MSAFTFGVSVRHKLRGLGTWVQFDRDRSTSIVKFGWGQSERVSTAQLEVAR